MGQPQLSRIFVEVFKGDAGGAEKERLYYGSWDFNNDPTSLCDFDAITDVFTNEVRGNGMRSISADLAMQGRDRFVVGVWNGNVCRIAVDKTKSTGVEIERDIKINAGAVNRA